MGLLCTRVEVSHNNFLLFVSNLNKYNKAGSSADFGVLGSNRDDEDSEVATEALCFMAVAINDSWKIPIGFFFIRSLNSTGKNLSSYQILIWLQLFITHRMI